MAGDLARLAREFAAQIAGLLNATVCDGIRISAVPVSPDLVLAGYGLSKQQLQHAPFAVTVGRRTPRCWLRVGYQLCLDGEGEYLTVASSVFGVYAGAQARQPLCRFDYERGKAGYAEAHLQVYGVSEVLRAWPPGLSGDHDIDCGEHCPFVHDGTPTRELERLHFPAGDRRYRPILEDVIEFLIIEQLADRRDGWKAAVAQGRETFRRHQLRAAIRDDPETAHQALSQLGHDRPA